MPSTTPERAARWTDVLAEAYLAAQGFKLSREWEWSHPSKELKDLTFDEEDAIIYLMEEWDYGGFCND